MNVRVSKKTLYSFQRMLEDVELAFFLKKFGGGLRRMELTLPKAYLVDNGIFSVSETRYDYGRLLEGAVMQELVKNGLEPNKEIFYWRSNMGREVDFVIREGGNVRQLIQATYASGRDEIGKRETDALIQAGEQLGCRNLIYITWDCEDEIKRNGSIVRCLPLWRWFIDLTYHHSS